MFNKETMSRLGALAVGLGVLSLGRQADACSCGISAYLGESMPTAGAQDVPTNVVPWLNMVGNAHLLDADGLEVPVRIVEAYSPVGGCSKFTELFPKAELEANAEYTILIDSDEDNGVESFTFTTGEGPLAEETLPVPPLKAGFFDAENYLNSCVYSQIQSCVAGNYEGLLEFSTFEDGRETRRYVDTFHGGSVAHGGFEAKEFCVEVRARDLAGRRSKAASFCSGTDSLYVLPPSDAWDPACTSELVDELLAEDSEESSSKASGGCSLARGPATRGLWSALLLPFLGGLVVSRRRRLFAR